MRYLLKALIVSFMLLIVGCSEQAKVNLDVSMGHVIDYKLHEVGAVQSDAINTWLTYINIVYYIPQK